MHPNQFQVNEAWIIFRLNEVPIRTADAGSFNCICLMDAGSCFILGNVLISDHSEDSETEIRELLKTGWQHKREFPTKLFVPVGQFETSLSEETEAKGIKVIRVPEGQLMPFIEDAKESFKEYRRRGSALPQVPNDGDFDPSLN